MKVAIVGGGISGLALAHALRDRAQVELFEASDHFGGNVRTTIKDGFVFDHGADSWVANKPAATELAKAVGLGDRLIETTEKNRRVYVVARNGRFVPLPRGLVLGVPTKLWPFLTTPLLSMRGKLRAALDLILPQGFGRDGGGDESVARWFERRLGKEVVDALAGPLLGGLYTGDVSSLSLRASFPQLASLEDRGSVIRAARSRAPKSKIPPSGFTSVRGGMHTFIDAVVARLGERVRRNTKVTRVERDEGKWKLLLADGEVVADHVAITGPAHSAADFLRDHDAELADALASIPYGSAATAFVGLRRGDVPHALDATGYIVTKGARRHAIAATWISSKWPDRAPDGFASMRVFFGADDVDRDDASLIELAREELRLRIGVSAAPVVTHVARFRRASPQPQVGHVQKMMRVRERLAKLGALSLLGSAYDGVGISDCVRQANEAAARITAARP